MSAAHEIYAANVGNTHEAALEAVWEAAYLAGQSEALANQPPIVPAGTPSTAAPVASDPTVGA